MTRKTYTEQFKRDAVRLVTVQSKTPVQAAAQVGVDENVLNRWVAKHAIGIERSGAAAGSAVPLLPEAAAAPLSSDVEIAMLRQEVRDKTGEVEWLRGVVGQARGAQT